MLIPLLLIMRILSQVQALISYLFRVEFIDSITIKPLASGMRTHSLTMTYTDDYNSSFGFTMHEEGVRLDDQGNVIKSGLNTTPGDPGGTTNFGFAQRF